jgi:TolB protein
MRQCSGTFPDEGAASRHDVCVRFFAVSRALLGLAGSSTADGDEALRDSRCFWKSQFAYSLALVAVCLCTGAACGSTGLNRSSAGCARATSDGRANLFVAFDTARPGIVAGGPGSNIYIARPDGSSLCRVTSGDPNGGDTDPSWSPDHRELVFISDRRDGLPEIDVVKADGSGARRLIAGDQIDYSAAPAWSPNGKWIAFARCPTACGAAGISPGISVIGADGHGLHQVTVTESADWAPAWSPDGKKIAFARGSAGEVTQIYVTNLNRTGLRRLTKNGDEPAWSPDGRSIAYTRADNSIWIMSADGTAQHPLMRGYPTGYVNFHSPTWSPDGKRIAFDGFGEGLSTVSRVFIANADGTGVRRVTKFTSTDPAW